MTEAFVRLSVFPQVSARALNVREDPFRIEKKTRQRIKSLAGQRGERFPEQEGFKRVSIGLRNLIRLFITDYSLNLNPCEKDFFQMSFNLTLAAEFSIVSSISLR